MVSLDRLADLTDADRAEAEALSLAVYPPEEWADWPGHQLEWAVPDRCIRVRDGNGQLVSFAGVYEAEATCDGRPVRVGGVGNVKTHPIARRRGHADRAVRRAVVALQDRGLAFALLVCAAELLPFYGRLGWREFRGRLLVRRYGEVVEFTLYRVMTHTLDEDGPATGTIDVAAPPW